MNRCKNAGCSRPAGEGAFACQPCGRALRATLDDAGWIVEELANTLTRQVRYGSGGSRPMGDSVPLLFDVRASDSLTRLDKVLTAAVDSLLAGKSGQRWLPPKAGVQAQARWLRARVIEIRSAEDGPGHMRAITAAFEAASRVVDRPADRWYAGPCNNELPATDVLPERYCGADLYAEAGAALVVCRRCGAEYDVPGRREWLLEAAEDELVDAAGLARAVSWLGSDSLSAERIRKWKQRGQLVPAGARRCSSCMVRPVVRPCPACRPLYRVGDALALVDAASRKRTAVSA